MVSWAQRWTSGTRWTSQRGPLTTAMLPCCPVFVGHMHNDVGGAAHGLVVISRDLPKEERLFCTRQKPRLITGRHPTKRAAGRPDPFNCSILENNMQMYQSSTEKRQRGERENKLSHLSRQFSLFFFLFFLFFFFPLLFPSLLLLLP